MQKKVWVQAKGKTANGTRGAKAGKRGGKVGKPVTTCSLHHPQNRGKAALQSEISYPS